MKTLSMKYNEDYWCELQMQDADKDHYLQYNKEMDRFDVVKRKIIVYHGTTQSVYQSLNHTSLLLHTWFAGKRFHAWRIAERRAKENEIPIVLEIEIDRAFLHKEISRNLSTYRYKGGCYTIIAVHSMIRTVIMTD